MLSPSPSDKASVDELTKEFLAESLEGLDRMDRCLTDLEQRPNDKELLGEIFRSVHTIKGTTGFLGFSRLEKLAHAGESLLGSLREGRLTVNTKLVGGLLQLMDGLRAILRLIEKTGKEGSRIDDDDTELILLMQELNNAGDEDLDLIAHSPGSQDAIVRAEQQAAGSTATAASAGLSEKTLRIDVEVLNRMMNLVGELVLTRNQILQSNGESSNFPELARRLDSVTADLRETVMQARMQPVGHVFSKFPRMVRDLALNCGKSVRIEFQGQETGLDKSLLEAVKDPLTHAVRNAIDHGIEEPRARAIAGKPLEGLVCLRAYHHNGSVIIEVEDDGNGISTARVLAKAIERGLVSEERAAAMSEREALQLVFEPGFSTAAKVTHVSGRGVGMDVVLANVEKVGGTVEIESHEGKGTLLRLRVPLTLAIVRALVVRSGGQSFCLPQSALAELVYVPWREAETSIEWIGDSELFRLRERLLPMVRLDHMLGLGSETSHQHKHGVYLVVLESEGCQYGLVVDDLMAPEEIVVKPLSPILREIGLFSGATVLGSGSLAMILDVTAAGVRAGIRATLEEAAPSPSAGALSAARSSFLIFEEQGFAQRTERLALPLSLVVRIESVALTDIEYAGNRPLLQYRGELLSLEDRGGVLRELDANTTATVLICQRPIREGERRSAHKASQRIGMVVRRVVEVASGDLMEHNAEICTERLAMVHDRLTVVHDVFAANERLRDVA
jgi:two-component system chemotaxis sensor kinase CheA